MNDNVPNTRNRRLFFNRKLPLEVETCFFILVNAMDVILTWKLLNSAQFRESNPLANSILQMFGFNGMIAFKFIMVAVVCLIAQIVEHRRRNSGRFLLIVGTIIVGAVVAYSFGLFFRGPPPLPK